MKTSFFYRIAARVAVACSALIVVVGCLYACFLGVIRTNNQQTVYFIVERAENVELSQSVAVLQGGAGYVFPTGEVALGVYFSFDTAQEVLQRVQSVRDSAYIMPINCSAESNDAAFWEALRCVEKIVNQLQHGLTQKQAAHILKELGDWFSYYGKEAKGQAEEAANYLGEELLKVSKQVIYVNELRYALCKSVASCAVNGEKIFLEG